jgi:hypothetical protein
MTAEEIVRNYYELVDRDDDAMFDLAVAGAMPLIRFRRTYFDDVRV